MPTATQATLHNPELDQSLSAAGMPQQRLSGVPRPAWIPAYIPELNGLRGLAVLAVVLYHCHARLEGTWVHYASLWCWTGVNLFFVLSGFLITGILLESRAKPHYFRNFYARRILRVWPLYLLLLIVCYAVPEWFLGDTLAHQANWKTLGAYFFFLQNLRRTPLPGTLGPTWSLAIEEQYYLLWAPILLWFGGWAIRGRDRQRPSLGWILPAILLGMLVLSPAMRMLHPAWITGTHTLIHLDGIAMGSLLAFGLHRFQPSQPACLWTGLRAAALGTAAAATIAGGTSFLDSALALAFSGVVLAAVAATGRRSTWLLRRGPLPFYGKISYGLYMTHILVFVYFGNFDARLDDKYHLGVAGNLIIVALRLVASTAVATALWYAFESQVLKLKRYF